MLVGRDKMFDRSPEFDNPWDWFVDHGCVEADINGSGFDAGIDAGGDLLIHREGHVAAVTGSRLAEIDGADPTEVLD